MLIGRKYYLLARGYVIILFSIPRRASLRYFDDSTFGAITLHEFTKSMISKLEESPKSRGVCLKKSKEN